MRLRHPPRQTCTKLCLVAYAVAIELEDLRRQPVRFVGVSKEPSLDGDSRVASLKESELLWLESGMRGLRHVMPP